MRIAIDIRSLTDEHLTGVGFYTLQLVKALATLAPQAEFVLFASGSSAVLNRLPKFKAPNITVAKLRLPNRIVSLLMRLPGGPMLERFLPQAPDVWIFPKGNFFKTQIPYLFTVHDLAFDIFPQFITGKERLHNRLVDLKKLVDQATGILAVSESTALDLEARWGVKPDKIWITPLGVEHETFLPREQPSDRTYRAMYDLNRPCILALATHEPRKNLESVIDGYDQFRAEGGKALPLVLIGADGWKSGPLKDRLMKSKFRADILVLGYVPNKHKPALYRGALCFVFPSFYEGFGLPVLEAMACGVPVITSATSSLPEVAGQAGVLIDPFNVNDVTSALQQLFDQATGKELRERLSTQGVEQAAKFTWDKTAEATLQAIDALTKQP